MMNLCKFKLEYDLAYKYFIDSLEGVNELSSQLIDIIDFKSGEFFTLLNRDVNLNKINSFLIGGIATGVVNKIRKLILDQIRNEDRITCVFDDTASSYSPEYKEPLFLDCGVHYKNQVYYVITRETSSENRIEDCFYASDAIWHSLCVLSKIRWDYRESINLSEEQIRNICINTQLIMLNAYDGEGYVFWEKSDF